MDNNLQNKNIQDTYPRLVQIIDGVLYDGNGDELEISNTTTALRLQEASNLIQTQNIYAKYILNHTL